MIFSTGRLVGNKTTQHPLCCLRKYTRNKTCVVWLYWTPFNPYIYVLNTSRAFKKHKEILKTRAYCSITDHLGMRVGFHIFFFLGKCWKWCKALCQYKALLFLLFHEIQQPICTCQGLRLFLQARNSQRCYNCLLFCIHISQVGLIS